MKKFILLCLLLAALPICVHAEELYVTDARIAGRQTQMGVPINAVSVRETQSGRFLFLPSYADPSNQTIILNGADSVIINGEMLYDGDTTDLFQPGTTLHVDVNGEVFLLSVMRSANIPAVFLTTESGSAAYIHESKDNRETGCVFIVEADGEIACSQALTQIRIRGNSTAEYEKKAYQIRLTEKQSLFGMEQDRTWALLANYIDRSLVRNTLALHLADAAGLPYAPQSTPVDVYLNHDYMGNYLLAEPVQIGSGRVEIADLEEATEDANDRPLDEYPLVSNEQQGAVDAYYYGYRAWRPQANTWRAWDIPINPQEITGGYLLEVGIFRDWEGQPSAFVLPSGWPLTLKSPEYATVEQVSYISGVFEQIDNALTNQDWGELCRLIDVDSFICKYVLEEILANYDGGTGSQFYYKEAGTDAKVFCGPVWDYDNTLGVNRTVGSPEGLYVAYRTDNIAAIFPRLWAMEAFQKGTRKAYQTVFRPLLSALLGYGEADGIETLSQYADEISASAEMNFVLWPIDYTYHQRVQNTGNTYQENISYVIAFLTDRVRFLDSVWQSP